VRLLYNTNCLALKFEYKNSVKDASAEEN